MKLASYKSGRDGELRMVSRNLKQSIAIPGIAANLRDCLDQWERFLPSLEECYQRLNNHEWANAPTFEPSLCTAPLPRAVQWLDGSAYINHVELPHKARGVTVPASLRTEPLMYQSVSDNLLGPCDPITGRESWGIDFEAELAVITDDVPIGCSPEEAHQHIMLLTLCNNISLRNLIPAELDKGFGFLHSKPPGSFGPVVVTPDELRGHWQNGKLNLKMIVTFNNQPFGQPDCAVDMTFSFHELIAHAARTRPLGRGTIISSGTVSNRDNSTGSRCLVERRMLETIASGQAVTPFLQHGDQVKIEILDSESCSVFGAISQVFHSLK